MRFWRSQNQSVKSDDDGEEEKKPLATGGAAGTGQFVGDPRGFGGERPLGASERLGHGAADRPLGATERPRGGEMGGTSTAAVSGQDRPERRKKSSRSGAERGERGSDDMMTGGGGATSSSATSQNVVPAASVNDFISKTKNQKRQGLKPSGPELIAYARYLGIDPVADHDLLWIAVEALEAPLPSTWSEHFDTNDRVFYYNASTRVSSWTHPLEHVYRETYSTIVTFRNSNLSAAERAEQLRKLQAECEQKEREVHREIGLWTEHRDEHGHRFYFNSQEKQSTWTDPRPAQCHLLYLKMKLVRVLSGVTGVAGAVAAAGQGMGAPPLSNNTPRRDQSGSGAINTDIGGKRAKVGSGSGFEPLDQFPRRGPNDANGSARGAGGVGPESDGDFLDGGVGAAHNFEGDGLTDAEAESAERHHKSGKKKKKDKKKRHHDGLADDEGHPGPNLTSLNHSQSEPTVTTKTGREAALPPGNSDESRGISGGPYPAGHGGHGYVESAQSSQISRTRVPAGIRLQPLQGTAVAAPLGDGPAGLHMSSSVPELKPLEKLHPL